VELALEVGLGESGASVSTWLPRVFSRKNTGSLPGSYPDRFDYFGQEWPCYQSDVGHWDADSAVLRQDSRQDWHPFAARNPFIGHTQWDGDKRGQPKSGFPYTPYKGCQP
jgi:hypothetical protein